MGPLCDAPAIVELMNVTAFADFLDLSDSYGRLYTGKVVYLTFVALSQTFLLILSLKWLGYL